MRKTQLRPTQIRLDETPIDRIKIDTRSEDDVPEILLGLQALWKCKVTLDKLKGGEPRAGAQPEKRGGNRMERFDNRAEGRNPEVCSFMLLKVCSFKLTLTPQASASPEAALRQVSKGPHGAPISGAARTRFGSTWTIARSCRHAQSTLAEIPRKDQGGRLVEEIRWHLSMVDKLEDQFGFFLHHRVMWKGGDRDEAADIARECQERFPDLQCVSIDRGFWSPEILARLGEFLRLPALPKMGRRARE